MDPKNIIIVLFFFAHSKELYSCYRFLKLLNIQKGFDVASNYKDKIIREIIY